jgi:hypothetical protein
MSINVSQIFVRYPDEKDVAEFLATLQGRHPQMPSFIVARTPAPWLAVCAGNNAPALDVARHLSRALEASALWFGLAGNALAYRFARFEFGRDVEMVLEPPEIFRANIPLIMPAYRDAEAELHDRLRALGLPAGYLYLFAGEIGVTGGKEGRTDAAIVRNGTAEFFLHRVPLRNGDAVRTLFDFHKEGEQAVVETLQLQGSCDPARARQLLQTLEQVCRRRSLPSGWKIHYVLQAAADPELLPTLERIHARGSFSFEISRSTP